jgi:hypothetical protein
MSLQELGLELMGESDDDAFTVGLLESPEEEEQPCPRSPWVVRAAGALVAQRWLLPLLLVWAPLFAFWDATCQTACLPLVNTCYWGADPQGRVADPHFMTPLRKLAWAFNGVGCVALVGVVPSLRRIADSEGPGGGALAALGAGTRTVAARASRTVGTRTVATQPLDLANWVRLATLATVLLAVTKWATLLTSAASAALGDCLFSGSVLPDLGRAVSEGTLAPLLIVWYLTLKMAAALAAHRVATLRRKVAGCDIQAPEWESEVVLEAQALINDTFPTLSLGWGPGAIALCAATLAYAGSELCFSLNSATAATMVERMVGVAAYTCVPLLVLWDLAAAGSECDLLTKGLNEKRIADPSDEAHAKIYKLEVMLNQLNKKQGLGFVLAGTVLDKAYFFGLITKLCGLIVTLIGSLLALRPDEAAAAARSCSSLTEAQEAGIKAWGLLNTSCTYNITIGPAGLVVH